MLRIDNNFTILFITYVLELSLNLNSFFILTFLNLLACDFVLLLDYFQMTRGESK